MHSTNSDPLLKELSDQYAQKNVGVMFAFKIKGTEVTDQPCLSFIVKNKLPLDQLASEDILPSEVTIRGKKYITDVITISNATTLSCPDQCTTWLNPAYPPPGNRDTVRPLVGGISIGSKNFITSSPECNVGTLGFIAVDSASQALVGVTASHVVVKNPFITLSQDLDRLSQNEKDNYVYQNGETCTVNPALQIGQVIRYAPLTASVPSSPNLAGMYDRRNPVDAALVSLKQSDISNTESFKQYGVNYNLPLPFATSYEIFDLQIRPELYSSGRTTGVKDNVPYCALYYFGMTYEIDIDGYNIQGQNTSAPFSNIILFRSNLSGCTPAAPGDSGSALVADFNGVRKIIGLVIGQAIVNGIVTGLACRIDWIAAKLGIEAWDGTPKNFIDPASISYTTIPGKSGDSAIKKDGKIHWQIGLIDPNATTSTTTTADPNIPTTSTTTSSTSTITFSPYKLFPYVGQVIRSSAAEVCPFTDANTALWFTGPGLPGTYPTVGNVVYVSIYPPQLLALGDAWIKAGNGHALQIDSTGTIIADVNCLSTTTTTTTI